MRSWLFTIALLALPVSAAPPHSLALTYSVKVDNLRLAEMVDTVNLNGQRYNIESDGYGAGWLALIPRAKIKRKSEGEITDAGLKPSRYEEVRGFRERSLAAQFDWQNRKLTLRNGESSEQIELPHGTLDRLCFPYGFAFLPKPPARWKVHIADGRHLTVYEFTLVGEKTIDTPLGPLAALHYSKVREADDTPFDIWLGIKQHHLPIRITYNDKEGRTFEQIIARIDHHRREP